MKVDQDFLANQAKDPRFKFKEDIHLLEQSCWWRTGGFYGLAGGVMI